MTMDVGEWQRALEDNFTFNGVIGGMILPSTMEQERICGSYFVKKFHGHRILADSFLDFVAITLRSVGDGHSKHGWMPHPYYSICLLEFVSPVSWYACRGNSFCKWLPFGRLQFTAKPQGSSNFPWRYREGHFFFPCTLRLARTPSRTVV